MLITSEYLKGQIDHMSRLNSLERSPVFGDNRPFFDIPTVSQEPFGVQGYEFELGNLFDLLLSRLKKATPGHRVLDLGMGAGIATEEIQNRFPATEVWGTNLVADWRVERNFNHPDRVVICPAENSKGIRAGFF